MRELPLFAQEGLRAVLSSYTLLRDLSPRLPYKT
jgi:hypothetical protein